MFLDQVTNRTIEIVVGRIYDYNKAYSKYMILREEILTQQRAAQKNQEKQDVFACGFNCLYLGHY